MIEIRGNNVEILEYSDSDWAGYIDTRQLTTDYVFVLAGAAISWKLCRIAGLQQINMGNSKLNLQYINIDNSDNARS